MERLKLVRKAFDLFFERLPRREMELLSEVLDSVPRNDKGMLEHLLSEWLDILRGLLSAFQSAGPLFERAYHCESVGDTEGLAQALFRLTDQTHRCKIWYGALDSSPMRGALTRSGSWVARRGHMDPLEEQGIIQVVAQDEEPSGMGGQGGEHGDRYDNGGDYDGDEPFWGDPW